MTADNEIYNQGCIERDLNLLKTPMSFADKQEVVGRLYSGITYYDVAQSVVIDNKQGDFVIVSALSELMLKTESPEERDDYFEKLYFISRVTKGETANHAWGSVIACIDKKDNFKEALFAYEIVSKDIYNRREYDYFIPSSDFNIALQRIVPTMNRLDADDNRIEIVTNFADNTAHVADVTKEVVHGQLEVIRQENIALTSPPLSSEKLERKIAQNLTENALLRVLKREFK